MCITKIRKPKQQTYPIQLQTVDQYQKINLKTIPMSIHSNLKAIREIVIDMVLESL